MTRNPLRSSLVATCCVALLAGCGQDAVVPTTDAFGSQAQAELGYNPGAGWTLAWYDEFDGTSLNSAYWNVLTSNFDPVTGNCNFGTGELEYPRAQNVTVANGKLVISAQRTGDNPTDPNCPNQGRSFYSGRIHTKGKVERRYGKIVASIKVPSGYGMWPAFWTLGANISAVGWPASGEVDILEWHSNDPTWMKSAVHYSTGAQADWGTGQSGGYNLADSFHTYEVEWTANTMVFRLDGAYVGATFNHNETEFQQNHYLLLNLALGGNWYGFPSPASIDLPSGVTKTMEVEWVRWYQPGSSNNVSLTNPGFESDMAGWATWSPNGTEAADYSETYNGAHTGAYHLTHWTNGTPFEVWTYQTKSGLAAGNYKLRAWVRKGGAFDLSRMQLKTCGSCSPVYVDLGTYAGWTQVETPLISVPANGSLEMGFHTRATVGNPGNYIHMDDVELLKQ